MRCLFLKVHIDSHLLSSGDGLFACTPYFILFIAAAMESRYYLSCSQVSRSWDTLSGFPSGVKLVSGNPGLFDSRSILVLNHPAVSLTQESTETGPAGKAQVTPLPNRLLESILLGQ
jgi:hypothetical protein